MTDPTPADRRLGAVLIAVWGVVAVIGLLATVSIFFSPFGIPLLLAWAPARAGWRLRRGHCFPRWWAEVGVVAPILYTAALAVIAGPWRPSPGMLAAWGAFVLWAVVAALVSRAARRPRHAYAD